MVWAVAAAATSALVASGVELWRAHFGATVGAAFMDPSLARVAEAGAQTGGALAQIIFAVAFVAAVASLAAAALTRGGRIGRPRATGGQRPGTVAVGPMTALLLASLGALGAWAALAGVRTGAARSVMASERGLVELYGSWGQRLALTVGVVALGIGLLEAFAAWRRGSAREALAREESRA